MFENVRSRESLYYLLSNNYVNNVINLKYDFSNEETLAYYIYLLRTLSFKLSKDTVYFFFNEQLDDFPLYSEAIKFFNHEESMIRIAVRVITLNVYSVNDSQMQDFILDRTTTTYFSNLVWFIGNYGTTINDMLLHPSEGDFSRINYYLAEHMDCFYYVNDIIELDEPKINKILISNLLNRLLRPMYLDSLLPANMQASTSRSSSSAGNLTSSTPPPIPRSDCGSVAMSRDRSSDSILSTLSTGVPGAWNISSPTPKNPSSLSGSLFGAAGSAAAARMRTRTDSPLFEIEDDNEESRETEELLASKDSEPISPPGPSTVNNPPRTLASSVPSSLTRPAPMTRGQSDSGGILDKSKSKSRSKSRPRASRKTSRTPSILGTSLLPAAEEPEEIKEKEDENDMGQELRPVYTSERDRQTPDIYPSTDDDLESDDHIESKKALVLSPEQDSGSPPSLPPRGNSGFQQDDSKPVQKPVCTQVVPAIQNREELLDRLMDIVCGQPESGAHRFRMITIQMAMELMIEFVFTKGVAAGKETNLQGNSSAVQAAESQLGEERLQRLALAEVHFRDRVQKGIRKLERKTRRESAKPPPLGMLTGKVERSLAESKLGIDRHIVNIISESAMVYGPDRDLDKEPDLNPDSELIVLFGLNPEFTDIKPEKPESEDNKFLQELQALKLNSEESTVQGGRRSRIRNKIKSKMQEGLSANPSTIDNKSVEQPSRPPPTRLSSSHRLEAMVIRYIKWLHILIQCRQLLCRKPITPAMALLGLDHQPTVATSFSVSSENVESKEGSPTISITETSDQKSPRLERRPSDLISISSSGTVVSAHKGLQKALATTATTSITGESEHLESLLESIGGEYPHPISSSEFSATTVADTLSDNAPPYVSRTSSSSSMTSSSLLGTGTVSVTLSQPASGTASGRIIGSRTLLSATAALEAAASSASHAHISGAESGSHQPSINDMLTSHLDPLSASVSEAIKKSSAKLKNSVVGSLAANTSNLFKYSATSLAGGDHHQQNQDSNTFLSSSAPSKGFYRPPSAIASASSSVASLEKPGSTGMQRSYSASSVTSSRSVPTPAPSNSNGVNAAAKSTAGSTVGRNSEDRVTLNDSSPYGSKVVEDESNESFLSILDEGYSGPQMDDQVFKILETLGLVNASV
ncbi:Protein CL16A [Entomortierella beljakovae]|nr:Protein CL16A [Entomortierella beljakovae]